jgi:hypothetical protein
MRTTVKAIASIVFALLSLFVVFDTVNAGFQGWRWPWLTLAGFSSILSLLLAVRLMRQNQQGKILAICCLLLAVMAVLNCVYWVFEPGLVSSPTLSPIDSQDYILWPFSQRRIPYVPPLPIVKLRQLTVAMLSFADQHGTLPPAAVYGKDGQSLLSWRVIILPYIEQEKLFHEFHLDEPWHSQHNIALLPRMPKLYCPPEQERPEPPFRTYYQVFVGKGAAFEGQKGLSLKDFKDEPSRTLLVVEGSEAVPWTKPKFSLHFTH